MYVSFYVVVIVSQVLQSAPNGRDFATQGMKDMKYAWTNSMRHQRTTASFTNLGKNRNLLIYSFA